MTTEETINNLISMAQYDFELYESQKESKRMERKVKNLMSEGYSQIEAYEIIDIESSLVDYDLNDEIKNREIREIREMELLEVA